MKKSLLVIAMASAIGISSSVYAQNCTCPEQTNTITVSANAVKEVTPDTVEINIEVQTEDAKSMQKAMTDNNEISQKILTGLKSAIKPEDGDYIKTSDFRADSLYKYNGNKRSFDKYMVTNNVIVHTKSIENIPAVIEKAISLGATGISNLNFSVSNYDKYRDELLTLAIQKAGKQAQTAAAAANVTIKGVKDIAIVNNDNIYSRTRYTAVNLKACGSADAAVPEAATPSIEPGIIKIQAGVNMTYSIK